MNSPLYGPYGSSALTYADHLASAGANACWFHGFDARAFDLCDRHGLAACVEFPTFRADFAARPELIPTGVDGQPIRYGELVQGICLSQVEFLAEVEESLLDGLATYAPRGIWLDYMTYAGWFETPTPDLQESCFCAACIDDFCEATGIDAATPQQILRAAPHAWAQHKCKRVARYAAHYAELIRARRGECIVGIYMCPWTPSEFEGALGRIFAQDYALLAPHVDVFTPLIYATKSGRAPQWARTFLEEAPSFIPPYKQVQLILDVLEFPANLQAAAEATAAGDTIRQSWGVQIFGGASIFVEGTQAQQFAAAVTAIQAYWQARAASEGHEEGLA
jgi:hypothetical protein